MSHHHGSRHGSHHHGAHGGGHHEAPARLFWTKRRVAAFAVAALAAMAVFLVLSACEQAPAPKGPEPVRGSSAAQQQAARAQAAAPSGSGAPPAPGARGNADASAAPAAPPPSQQAGGFPVSGPEGDQTVIEVGGLVMPKPITWVWTAPTMQFRALQYAVPALGVNSPAAELVFSVFTGGEGGPVAANLDRWANQFRDGDAAAASRRSEREIAGLKVHLIESAGAYMGMGAAAPRPGCMQLGAIVEAPGRNVFMKIVGPQATVESNRAAFEAMLAGMKAK
jgi:hypothetical protein